MINHGRRHNQSHVATASIKKPIHNVKERRSAPHILPEGRNRFLHLWKTRLVGGAYRDRTDDLMLAKQPLSQLS
jgi:hypothetical protein